MPSRDPEQRKWYGTGRWKVRQRHQMQVEPLCRHCAEWGIVRAAVFADHIEPHRGDRMAFMTGELQSLCRQCHGRKRGEEKRGYRLDIAVDGTPIDFRHSAYGRR